jgi:hypothetical protein
MPASSHHRAPRARIDPILSVELALDVFSMQMSRPMCHETLVMFLDGELRGGTLVSVTGTDDPFQIVEIAETMALTAANVPEVSSMVLATVRPGGRMLTGDDELWLQASDAAAESGLDLVDWLIIGRRGVERPRELLGLPSRWASGT